MRTCQREAKICGTVIPKGTIVHFPIKMIHYHSRYWENPQEFNPDRSVSKKQVRCTVNTDTMTIDNASYGILMPLIFPVFYYCKFLCPSLIQGSIPSFSTLRIFSMQY